jgi:hypothetical protein
MSEIHAEENEEIRWDENRGSDFDWKGCEVDCLMFGIIVRKTKVAMKKVIEVADKKRENMMKESLQRMVSIRVGMTIPLCGTFTKSTFSVMSTRLRRSRRVFFRVHKKGYLGGSGWAFRDQTSQQEKTES